MVLRSGDSSMSPPLYRLVPCVASKGDRCRCGSWFAVGGRGFRFDRFPEPLEDLLDGERFCGPGCARAYLLEALELTDSTLGASVISDLPEVRASLRYMLMLVESVWGPAGLPSVPGSN